MLALAANKSSLTVVNKQRVVVYFSPESELTCRSHLVSSFMDLDDVVSREQLHLIPDLAENQLSYPGSIKLDNQIKLTCLDVRHVLHLSVFCCYFADLRLACVFLLLCCSECIW